MRHSDKCIITRTTTTKDTITHIAKTQTSTLPEFDCRLGKASGTLVQATPQGTFIQQQKIYIHDVAANIKSGDIATINNTTKYTVGNVYKPNNHHIEAYVTYKEEV